MAGRRAEPLWWVAAPLLRLFVHVAFRLRVDGGERLPRTGPALLVANHVSHVDPVVLLVTCHRLGRRARFLHIDALLRVPLVGFMLHHSHMLPVTRGAGPQALAATGRAAIDSGEVVVVYPEGTLPRGSETLPARPGAGLLAQSAETDGVPVLPVALAGMERGRVSWRRLRRRAAVVVGEPLAVDAGAPPRQVSQALLGHVRALLPRARALARGG